MSKKNGKIVIADDNKELCDLVGDIMKRIGYTVDFVHNGYELIDYLKNNDPSVIILDLIMPDKDGLSIVGTLKQLSPRSKIIIYTGYQKYKNSVYARTADEFILKGGSIKKLISAVEEFM
ncbi:MAG: response regulator [Candidatus Omnitrophota bacterium]